MLGHNSASFPLGCGTFQSQGRGAVGDAQLGEQEGRASLTFIPCELWGEKGQSPRWVGGQGVWSSQHRLGLTFRPLHPSQTHHLGSPTELGTRGRCPLASSGWFKTNSTVETVLLLLNKHWSSITFAVLIKETGDL